MADTKIAAEPSITDSVMLGHYVDEELMLKSNRTFDRIVRAPAQHACGAVRLLSRQPIGAASFPAGRRLSSGSETGRFLTIL